MKAARTVRRGGNGYPIASVMGARTLPYHLGKDPDVRYMPSGNAVANVTVATNESWKDKQTGENQERTEWHNVVFYGKLAEIAGEYLRKGRQVYIEGSLRTRKWQDKNGQDRYTTEIIANDMQMLGSRDGGSASFEPREPRQQPSQEPPTAGAQQNPSLDNDFDDDIPFVRSDYALPYIQNEAARLLRRSCDELVPW